MKLMILDGNSILNRGFYGIRPLTAPDGTPTNAVYGFLTIFNRLYADLQPDAVCVAFDVHAPTFRHLACDSYKATRKAMPEELRLQVPVMKEVLREMGIRTYELQGYEADDLIGTVSSVCEKNRDSCVVVTGDKDSLQLVSDLTTVCIIKTVKGETTTTLFTPDVFREQYGFAPRGMVDLKALMGDSSDNISGVPGIGEKGAMDLMHLAGSLEALYRDLDTLAIRETVRKKLREGEADARRSYWLATIFREVPMAFDAQDTVWDRNYRPGLYDIFRRLGFSRMIEKYHLSRMSEPGSSAALSTGALSLDTALSAAALSKNAPGMTTDNAGIITDASAISDKITNGPTAGDDGSGSLPGIPSAAASEASASLSGKTKNNQVNDSIRTAEFHPLPIAPVTAEHFEELQKSIREAPYVAVLVPGENLDSIEICDGKTVYTADRLSLFQMYDELLNTVFSPEIKKVSSDCKDLMHILLKEGLSTSGFIFDCALAAYMITGGDGDYSVSSQSVKYFGTEAAGTAALHALYPQEDEHLKRLGMDSLYDSAELPLCECLAEMEYKGFLVDRKALYEFGESLTGQIEALRSSIVAHAGHEFNINSPRQLGEVLFGELQLPNGKKTKTGWSTSAEILENIASFHPIVNEILEYRMLTKLKSTYADGLLKVITEDGRIHTCFRMTATSTGRLSSTEPNLQNIPVRKQLGAQIRRMFVAPAGSVLVDADYSQIELRVLAHLSGDQNMISAFRSGQDFHTVTAANVFRLPVSQVTPEIRSRAKAVNFGIVYGMAAFTLAKDTGVSVREAKEYMEAYFAEYSGVDHYLKKAVSDAEEKGYAVTVFGRRRYIPELRNSSRTVREFGKRVAMNMPVQGTAADIIKLAMVSVRNALLEAGLQARLVLQVHDELIVECPENEKERVCAILKESMEKAVTMNIPLPVEVGSGISWAEAH